ncbi:ABC transporter substrate-binding protein [Pseudalkalibacillus caeni]|uniref:Sugar ABC transporter substrate-binding protein n=1 Tax=Exobacillus caeni TaxID=2574798 RepID=A0A5R9F8J2_9BACL|nr:sugar ABC transporter substrate-binding protein [Pseudalkalibacillus caeni]TLS38636.1 sugar ABC transporter substrate-binding protein [Pseudalkalibacillus caeni]
MNALRKWCVPLVMIAMVVGLLAGCSSSEESDAGSEGDTVTLKMIESLTSPNRTKLLKEMISDFEEKNPNIKVELISPPLQSADEKIAQMMMAKEDIDVLEVRDQTVKQFSGNDFIEDLSPYVDKWENWDTVNENAKGNALFIDDTPYFIPYGLYQKTLFYRKDWFEEAGLEVPKTWDDLYDAAVKLTDPKKNRYGYSFRGGAGSSDYVEFTTWAYVGEDIDPEDGYFLKGSDKNMFATPEAKDAMNMFVKLYEDASPPDSVSWSYPEMVQGFTSGVTAMLIQDPEVIVTADEKMEEGTWDTAPLPLGPSGIAQQAVGAAGWGMTSYSKHKDEAWKLIEYLSNPEQNLYFAKNNSLIPIHTTAADDPFFKEGYFESYIKMNENTEQYRAVNRPVDYQGWGEFRGDAEKDIQALLLEKTTVEDVLEKWSAFWNEQKANK